MTLIFNGTPEEVDELRSLNPEKLFAIYDRHFNPLSVPRVEPLLITALNELDAVRKAAYELRCEFSALQAFAVPAPTSTTEIAK